MQFTLCHVLKGNKPDFHNAMTSELSQPMYADFLTLLGSKYKPEAIKGAVENSTCTYMCYSWVALISRFSPSYMQRHAAICTRKGKSLEIEMANS